MPGKQEKKYNKEEVGYQKQTYNYQQKCDKCSHKNRTKDNMCEILTEDDNDVSPNGWCAKFNPGKRLIIDDGAGSEDEENIAKQRIEWQRRQERKRKLKLAERNEWHNI